MALGSNQPRTEMTTRNFPKGKGRTTHKADQTAICEPRSRKCGSLDVSQTFGPPRPVTGIALPLHIPSLHPSEVRVLMKMNIISLREKCAPVQNGYRELEISLV
jgi:hypothetical protein